jgi:hypothetical protein
MGTRPEDSIARYPGTPKRSDSPGRRSGAHAITAFPSYAEQTVEEVTNLSRLRWPLQGPERSDRPNGATSQQSRSARALYTFGRNEGLYHRPVMQYGGVMATAQWHGRTPTPHRRGGGGGNPVRDVAACGQRRRIGAGRARWWSRVAVVIGAPIQGSESARHGGQTTGKQDCSREAQAKPRSANTRLSVSTAAAQDFPGLPACRSPGTAPQPG